MLYNNNDSIPSLFEIQETQGFLEFKDLETVTELAKILSHMWLSNALSVSFQLVLSIYHVDRLPSITLADSFNHLYLSFLIDIMRVFIIPDLPDSLDLRIY